MSLSLRVMDPQSDAETFEKFVARTYGPDSFLMSRAYRDWWFAGSPARRSAESSDILIASFEGRIVGMNAHIAIDLETAAGSVPFVWLANTMIEAKFRNRGIGVLLLRASVEAFGNLGVISSRPAAERMLRFVGFDTESYGELARAVMVLEPNYLEAAGVAVEELRCPAASSADGVAAPVVLEREAAGKMATLWASVRSRYGVATRRNEGYVAWRFFDHPVGEYVALTTSQDAIDAVCVVRLDGDDLVAARIVDLWGRQSAVAHLIEGVVGWARGHGCAFVDFSCAGSPDRQLFTDAGFRWLPEGQRSRVPFLLNPVDLERPYLEQIALRFAASRQLPGTSLYLVRADADRDRPREHGQGET